MKCPKCGSKEMWVDLFDLPLELVKALEDESGYVKIDISSRKLKCVKCEHEFSFGDSQKGEKSFKEGVK